MKNINKILSTHIRKKCYSIKWYNTQTGQAQQLQFNQTSPEQQMEEFNTSQGKLSPEERVRNAEMSLLTRDIKSPQQYAYIDRVVKSKGMDYLKEIGDFTRQPLTQILAQRSSGIPAAGYADGGNVVGGEYDFESARQMYGLGKLVKKITRSVKKIAKSPLGKLALGAAAALGLAFDLTADLEIDFVFASFLAATFCEGSELSSEDSSTVSTAKPTFCSVLYQEMTFLLSAV